MRNNYCLWGTLVGFQFVAGCCLLPPKTADTAPVHEVIDNVKDQLRSFYTSPLYLAQSVKVTDLCHDANNMNVVIIKPTSAKLTLKTVSTTEYDPSLGLVAPLGVLKIDPAYSGAYSRQNAQSLEVDLKLDELRVLEPKTNAEMAMVQATARLQTDHLLRDVVSGMGQELLKVDHTKRPCITPTEIKSVINFDVVNKSTGGIGIEILGFKAGNKMTAGDEYHQVLEIDFSLAGSSLLLP